MDSVVVTVSGYHGSERFKLIKLINHTGASYLGIMSKSTTHLVCWRFEGRKYDLAKEFGTTIVSHRWFEDCLKAGKRLPERHYIMKSGQQVGPLLWEVPTCSDKDNIITTKKDSVLSDRSNTCNPIRVEIGAGSVGYDSCLLKENHSFDLAMDENFHKRRRSMVQKNSKQACSLSSTNHSIEKSLLKSVRVQHDESCSDSSSLSSRHKRSIDSTAGSSAMVPTHRSRRLVRRNDCKESTVSYSEHEYTSMGICGQLNTTTVATDGSHDLINEDATIILDVEEYFRNNSNNISSANNFQSPENGPIAHGRTRVENKNEELEDVEDIRELNGTPIDSNKLDENLPLDQERASQNGVCNCEENRDKTPEICKFRGASKLPTSTELSCVICWTDFSSTRGVLPCGHRFCYSCIQNWADHMASMRKASTCPLCKASFMSITKVDGAGSSDQKIYSQTIPYDSSTNIFVLPDWEISSFGMQSSGTSVCCHCRFREPEDLLISCHLCLNRWVHSYCLDPPLVPWTCSTCRDHRALYRM